MSADMGPVVAMHGGFTYVGKVRGQGRPRFRRNGTAYETKEDADFKRALANAYRDQCGLWFGEGPLYVAVTVMRHLPKSTPKRIRSEPDTMKPDADNIAKAVLDALNGVAYADDRQVVILESRKFPRVRFDDDNDRLRITIADVGVDTIYPYLFDVE